jgi:hypothetical protein
MSDVVQVERDGWHNSAISFIIGSKSLPLLLLKIACDMIRSNPM